ncbi:Threonine efflux protein [hydrothermal vent metagenome]|uniref:Threonine efflux protein n=1 Tax=hydrothermal vent metagenome TaxID=652676 RepID=A0A3B0TVL6_9ZZZZ
MEWTFVLVGVFAIFIPALMLPGPDFVAVVRSSMAHGTSAGIFTTIGVSIGLGFYASLSLLGLSAILVEYQWLAWIIRVCGGSYLVYLGVKLIFTKSAPIEIEEIDRKPRENSFLFGFGVTLTNPKAIVLFTSVFATAVSDAMPLWLMVLMIGLVIAVSLIWYSIVSIFMSSAPMIARFQNTRHWIERAAGVSFVGIGGRILADSRNPITP